MAKQTPPEFFTWLDVRLKDLDLSDSDLANRAGISHSVISKARHQIQGIGWDAALAIAGAINVPPEVVLRKVELLPPANPQRTSPVIDEMVSLFSNLGEDDQEELLQLARLKLERRKRSTRGKKTGS